MQKEYSGDCMENCRKTLISKVVRWLSILVIIPIGMIFLINGFCFLVNIIIKTYSQWTNILIATFSFLAGIFLLWLGNKEHSFESRKYLITSEGLYLSDKQKSFYAWHQIYEIGVFAYDTAASLQVYDKVICCSFSTPPDDLKDHLFYNTRLYAQRHQDKFVIIDYDESIIGLISQVYQNSIIDHTIGMKGHIRNKRRT